MEGRGASIVDGLLSEGSWHNLNVATGTPELDIQVDFLLLAKVKECNWLVGLEWFHS
jgi:hypothetical protein